MSYTLHPATGERLTCAKARRVERLLGNGAQVVHYEGRTVAHYDGGTASRGYGHAPNDASRAAALDQLLRWATEDATAICIDLQQWAASLADEARRWLGHPDAAARRQHEAAELYAEARRLLEALTEPWGAE